MLFKKELKEREGESVEQQNKYRPKNKKNEIWDPLVLFLVIIILFFDPNLKEEN